MAKFKIIISDPETGKSNTLELEDARAIPLIGRKIGEQIDGSTVDLPNCKIQITGGSDKDGFPMRKDIHGGVRKNILLSGGTGYKQRKRGERKRKTIRGNTITEEIVQLNMKIIEKQKKKKAKKRKKKPLK